MVLRLMQQAEIPVGFPINANDSTVDYEYTEVGGKQYLLPAHAYVKTRSGRFVAENNVEFREYRKFQTEATITFDPPPDKSNREPLADARGSDGAVIFQSEPRPLDI